MDWDDETIARLRVLWDEGYPAGEIGRRMGISKNAIIGKAHRIGLPARPSPIKRDGAAPRPARPPRATGPTLPPLASVAPEPAVAAPPRAPQRAAPAAPVPPAPIVVPRAPAADKKCCWPIGDVGTKEFRFCDAAALAGRPYCEAHAKRAAARRDVGERCDAAIAGVLTGPLR